VRDIERERKRDTYRHTHARPHIYTHTGTHTHARVHVHTHTPTHSRDTFTFAHLHIHTHTHARTHACAHKHAHLQTCECDTSDVHIASWTGCCSGLDTLPSQCTGPSGHSVQCPCQNPDINASELNALRGAGSHTRTNVSAMGLLRYYFIARVHCVSFDCICAIHIVHTAVSY
jgi:hypothetical protein